MQSGCYTTKLHAPHNNNIVLINTINYNKTYLLKFKDPLLLLPSPSKHVFFNSRFCSLYSMYYEINVLDRGLRMEQKQAPNPVSINFPD
jgi:hypothetical protein